MKEPKDLQMLSAREVRDAARDVVDSDEMYDLLPGDGQDDFIISAFNRMLDEYLAGKIAAAKEAIKQATREHMKPRG